MLTAHKNVSNQLICSHKMHWAFSSKDNPPAYGWNMEDYLPIHNGSCWIYKSDKHY